jgi:hypothetical protein
LGYGGQVETDAPTDMSIARVRDGSLVSRFVTDRMTRRMSQVSPASISRVVVALAVTVVGYLSPGSMNDRLDSNSQRAGANTFVRS